MIGWREARSCEPQAGPRLMIGASLAAAQTNDYILYEPDEPIPPLAALGHGLLSIAGRLITLAAISAIVVEASGQPSEYTPWLFSVSAVVCGLGTIAQVFQFGRFGSGYAIGVVSTSAFIAVVIAALTEGGPALLASTMVVSSILLFLFIQRLSLLRRIITPTVTGTVLMLLAATVMSVLLNRMSDTAGGGSDTAALAVAGTTLGVMMGLRLFAPPVVQQWTPFIGILAGCVVAVPVGLYDTASVADAAWIGVPLEGWPGFGFNFGVEFWTLLPGLAIVYLAAAIYGISDTISIQQVSWRTPRATDFRVVQGAFNVMAVTNLLAAVASGLPNTVPTANSAHVLLTGVAARRVGIYAGCILLVVAVLPKAIAVLTAIPTPLFAAYVIVRLALLFVQGMRLVIQGGLDPRTSTVVGVSFWLGVGFQNDLIFPNLITGPWEILFSNGLTTGCVAMIFFTVLINLTQPRARSLSVNLDILSLPKVDEYLREIAAKAGWDEPSTDRLRSAGEETLASLLSLEPDQLTPGDRNLIISTRSGSGTIEMEFVATSEEQDENLEDRLAYLGDTPQSQDDNELTFRLLRHYASSVQHRKYHEIDVVTVQVEAAVAPGRAAAS